MRVLLMSAFPGLFVTHFGVNKRAHEPAIVACKKTAFHHLGPSSNSWPPPRSISGISTWSFIGVSSRPFDVFQLIQKRRVETVTYSCHLRRATYLTASSSSKDFNNDKNRQRFNQVEMAQNKDNYRLKEEKQQRYSYLPRNSFSNEHENELLDPCIKHHTKYPTPQSSSSDVFLDRSLYQFRPLPPDSKREIPPPILSDCIDNYYNYYDNLESHRKNSTSSTNLSSIQTVSEIHTSTVQSTHTQNLQWSELEKSTDLKLKPLSSMIKDTREKTTNELISVSSSSSSSSSTTSNLLESDDYRYSDAKSSLTNAVVNEVASKTNSVNSTQQTSVKISLTSNDGMKSEVSVIEDTPSFIEPGKPKAMINFSSDEQGESPTGAHHPNTSAILANSNGNSNTPQSEILYHQLQFLTSQIYHLNNGVQFNIASPKQVAQVLFGENDGSSTNKDALEALASTGNELAACIYKYRKVSREYKRELKREEQIEKGDKKNDYYGNLERKRNSETTTFSSLDDDVKDSAVAVSSSVYASVNLSESQKEAKTHHQRREPLLLIDASSYIFRAYHAIPPLHHSDGTPTGALHGVCRMLQNLLLNRLLKGDRPRVVLVFDCKGPNFRHSLYPLYKANRGPCPEDLIPQFDLVREAANAFGIMQVEAVGYEADDVIATLCRQALEEGIDVDILTGDKDLMQLITPLGVEPSVHMIDPMHFDRVTHDDVIRKWGVSSSKLGDVLALAGDSSDNIPGVPGIGPKIAASLMEEYHSLENLLEQVGSIKQKKRRESLAENAEKVLLFRKLVSLDDKIPREKMNIPSWFESVSNFRMVSFDPNKLLDFYSRLELNSSKKQLQSRLKSSVFNYKAPPSPDEYEGILF